MPVRASTIFFLVSSFFFLWCLPAQAAFDVSMWNLRTSVISFFHPPGEQDVDRITAISNPLLATTISSLNGGMDWSRAQYDYAWNGVSGTGYFNTTLSQAIRTPETRNSGSGSIEIYASNDLQLNLQSAVTYFHTPGDETGIHFGASVIDLSSNIPIAGRSLFLGNLNSQPSSATRTIESEATLLAGHSYRLQYTLVTDNGGDVGFPPTGIADASAWVNFTITPEPSTAMLLALVAPFLIRRHR